jgi:hypothetical protein
MAHEILDNITHQDLKIITRHGREYGDNLHCVPAYLPEFRQLQSDYPLFLRKNEQQQFEPLALLGLVEQENLFLTPQGWDAAYIPLSIQRQPFLIGFQTRVENGIPQQHPVVCVDMAHPRISHHEGETVFLSQGGNSPYLQQVTTVLATIQQAQLQNQKFVAALTEMDLIEPVTLEFTFAKQHRIDGLYTINEPHLSQLKAEQLQQLHSQGYLQHIYMMIASAINIRSMVRRKQGSMNAAG